MDNNKFQNNVYQVPASQSGESFDVPADTELSAGEVEQRFSKIAREEVLIAFNQMTEDLEMSLSGYENRQVAAVEIEKTHPIAVELLQIGAEIIDRRTKHQALVDTPRLLGRIIGRKSL